MERMEAALERSLAWNESIDGATAARLLREAKETMDQLGMVFFLRQGTCLGAIRDNGFIPWDDDIDLGSVIGLHGLTQKSLDLVVDRVATAFSGKGYFTRVERSDHYTWVGMVKSSIRMDWVCYRIIDESIFHYPGIRFPLRMFTELREIDFIGEKFLVPNPPEEYLQLKYGPNWTTPKQVGYEKDIVEMAPEAPVAGHVGRFRQFITTHILRWRASNLRVLDNAGKPVSGAEVVIPGLGLSRTNKQGYTRSYLPGLDIYALVVRYGSHEEVLYEEKLGPGGRYVYRPDPSLPGGRLFVLSPE